MTAQLSYDWPKREGQTVNTLCHAWAAKAATGRRVFRVSRWLIILLVAGVLFPAAGWSGSGELTKAIKQSKDLQRQGKIEEALPFAEQALSIIKAIFGKDDLNVAILHDHLAAL